MAKPAQLKMFLRALFAIDGNMRARWGSMDSHPIANAKIMVEGTALSARSMIYGAAQMDVSSLSSGDYVLALTPDMGDLLKTSNEPVCSSDGNKKDPPGKCRYKPLRIKVSLEVTEGRVEVTGADPCDGVSHGRVSYLPQTGLMIDWRPDWVACKHSGPRPGGIAPSLILLHRTEASTPGSTLDSFRSSKESSHYLVDVDGHVIKLVHEGLIANHAGSSFWNDQNHVNSRSIGIEIVNAGGDFSPQQYAAVIRLIQDLKHAYPGISRHDVLAHGDVQVRSDEGLEGYRDSLSGPEDEQPKPRHDLTLDSRAGCPGVCFDWTVLEEQGLCSKADASLFGESKISQEYGGFFRNPFARLSMTTKDEKLLGEDKKPYGVIAGLQSDLQRLGYSVSAVYGKAPNGSYDYATQCAVDRFRRRYMHGVVPDNEHLSAIFDRATAIALKRVLLDRNQ